MSSYLVVGLLSMLMWLIYKVVVRATSDKRTGPYPPGPKPKPLIGNMLDFPQSDSPREYLEMGRKYNSNIIHLQVLGSHSIIVNSFEDAEELLEKRARIYSDLTLLPMLKVMGWEHNVSLMRYNQEWRQHRKVCQQNFRPEEAVKYLPTQMEKVHEMLKDLVNTPDKFDLHNKKQKCDIGDSFLYAGKYARQYFPYLGACACLVTPGAHAVQVGAEVKRYTEEVKRIPMEITKKMMADGSARPSLVTDFYERQCRVGASEEEEEIIKNVANIVYGGASDTTISATTSFFYMMAISPHVQRRAQAELDRVVGRSRLPNINDRIDLPYIEAIYREVLRMVPPLPFSLTHASTEDDYYRGFFIPKGTTVMPNIWAMNHDENKYEDAFTFKPERFLDESGKLNDSSRILAYGFGRRICIGKYIASSTLWLMMASIIACFNIDKAKDEQGNDIEIDNEFEDFGMVRHKTKFRCSFNVRSQETYKLIFDA